MRAPSARSAAERRLCVFAQSSGASARGRELQCGIEARDRIGDAGDVLGRLALGQQHLGLGDRLAPGFVRTHFSARISAKVSFATSSDSRISGTPT